VSSALKQVLNERAFAVLADLRPKGWQTCEVRCSLSAGAEIDARVRDFLRSPAVMLVTSAVDGPDAVFLVGVAALNELRAELAKIDPTRILVRIAGELPFDLAAPPGRALAHSVRVEVKYSELPKPKPVAVAAQPKAPARSNSDDESKDQKAEFLRVDARKISLLLDLASEIGLACGAVTHHPALEGLELEGYSQAAHKLELLVREMQNEVSGMRLVAVAGVFQRMRRVVRDTAMRTGKEVELVLEGEETEIDKVMVDALQDPLVHVLRNAIDHGIELPEERVALGKSRVGRIVLSASHQGGEVSIEVSDDGAGIKRDRVRERAESRGLIEPGKELSDDETLALVFAPGFSTKETVDELSGRGVGMDVVKTTITGLRGRVGLKSTEGRGSRLTMTMPLTLAFVESMVVRERDRLFALPIEKVFEVFKAEASQISRNSADGQTLVKVRGTMVPVLWLHRFWSDQSGVPTDDVDGRILVVVQTSHGEFALPVDALLGNQQVMLKPLRGPLAGIRAAAGCGMLRTGDVALAIDCEQLYA
jgi:two-component system chemotaxis sensor kinase CheA